MFLRFKGKGLKRTSMKSLNVLVRQVRSATVGLSFKSDSSVICAYSCSKKIRYVSFREVIEITCVI